MPAKIYILSCAHVSFKIIMSLTKITPPPKCQKRSRGVVPHSFGTSDLLVKRLGGPQVIAEVHKKARSSLTEIEPQSFNSTASSDLTWRYYSETSVRSLDYSWVVSDSHGGVIWSAIFWGVTICGPVVGCHCNLNVHNVLTPLTLKKR
jgi:hypothetical protein